MAISNAITTRWAAAAKVIAQENSIVGTITSGSYQVESEGAKKITVIGVSTPTISDYVPGSTTLTYEALTDNKVDIDIDIYKEFSFTVDEVQVAQSTPDYVPAGVEQAAKALAITADAHVFGLYSQADSGNIVAPIGTPTSITSANVLTNTSKLARKLRENHVNRGEMWLAVPPWYMDLLQDAAGQRLTDNAEVMAFGAIYEYAGLKIVESTEVVQNAGVGTDETVIMAFSARAIPFVSQINKIESLMNPNAFGELVRGLFVFGADTIFPKELAYMACEEG